MFRPYMWAVVRLRFNLQISYTRCVGCLSGDWVWYFLPFFPSFFSTCATLRVKVKTQDSDCVKTCDRKTKLRLVTKPSMYTQSNKNPSAWYFVRPAQAVTCGTVAIIIWVVFLSPYLRLRGVSLSSIHYNQSHRVYIKWKQQYICLIWN